MIEHFCDSFSMHKLAFKCMTSDSRLKHEYRCQHCFICHDGSILNAASKHSLDEDDQTANLFNLLLNDHRQDEGALTSE